MKKYILIISVLIVAISCDRSNMINIDNGIAYYKDTEKLFSGTHQEYWKNGEIKSEITYVNGEKTGKYVFYYENGNRWYEGSILNGKENGLWTEWHKNGQFKEQGTFIKGLKNGFWVEWNEQGDEIENKLFQSYENSLYGIDFLIHDFTYRNFVLGPNVRLPESYLKYKDGEKIFAQFVFHIDYKNNIKKRITKSDRNEYIVMDIVCVKEFDQENSNKKDSLISSLYIEYTGDKAFSKIRRTDNVNGKRIEKNIYYYPDGKKRLERNYVEFKKEGIWKWWNENGQVELELKCKNDTVYDLQGRPVNDTLIFSYQYEDAEYHRYTPLVDGMENGREMVYRDTVLREIWEYKDGLYNGQSILFHDNGQIQYITDYRNDTIHGKVISFFASGDTNLVMDYKNGQATGEGCYHYEDHGRLGGYFKNVNDSVTKVTMLGYYGDVWQTFTKVNDLVHGEYLIYYIEEDTVKNRINFDKGTKQGKCSHYYRSGSPKAIYNYWYDILDGKFTLYYTNGSVKVEGYWDNGAKSGVWKKYNQKGELVGEGEYADGILIRGETINFTYDFNIENLTMF